MKGRRGDALGDRDRRSEIDPPERVGVRAAIEGDRDDPGRARKLLDELAEEQPGSAAVSFAEALFAAASGELEDARSHLDEAIHRAPGARDFARREPTLAPLLDEP